MTAIWAVGVIVVFFSSLPYGIWILGSAFKKKWRKVIILLAAPIIAGLVLWRTTLFFDTRAHAEYLVRIYDTKVELGTPLFSYESPRSFNGDGYSFVVYPLPAAICNRFLSADRRLLAEFPKCPDYRKHWTTHPWHEAPADANFSKYLDFALSRYDAESAADLTIYFRAIRKALARKQTYYAFFVYDHEEYPGNIDLFIVDILGNRLYLINHNT
ncbi:MAG: hypothetical protein WGN25_19200 [Candidatus Electrothrix sp. GW3-4]|uniref:hypothetical protein n=1 Tax=Candidatus Electrothrix sp. GW3-4 TaxID=3126740 RepID=UPI0030CF2461